MRLGHKRAHARLAQPQLCSPHGTSCAHNAIAAVQGLSMLRSGSHCTRAKSASAARLACSMQSVLTRMLQGARQVDLGGFGTSTLRDSSLCKDVKLQSERIHSLLTPSLLRGLTACLSVSRDASGRTRNMRTQALSAPGMQSLSPPQLSALPRSLCLLHGSALRHSPRNH